MAGFTEPFDAAQATLCDIVWSVFAAHGSFPVYDYVRYRMEQRGLDVDEVLAGLPSIEMLLYRGRYRAIGYTSGGGLPQPDSRVFLTMAGLYQVGDHRAMEIIRGMLAYLRAMSKRRDSIGGHPLEVVNVAVGLQEVLEQAGIDRADLAFIAAVAEHEWPGMSVTCPSPEMVSGSLGLLRKAEFHTIEEYLNAITAATTPQRATTILQYHDPNALVRSITNFDITCELVLTHRLVKAPALTRTALLSQAAATHSDLQAGISALGELLSELQVPGKNPSHATGRLGSYLATQLPAIDQSRVQQALDVMDAVREIRNSGVHPMPSAKLIAAHELLGLTFPVREPAQGWNIIRAQMEHAFSLLQEEIYAARP